MLTLFCSPKPFIDESYHNQRIALKSWRAIHPDIEIFIFGAPQGAAEAAIDVDAILVPEIDCSPSGAPSFNAMAAHVGTHGKYDLQLYVNCDILLNRSIVIAMQAARSKFDAFLMMGERLDLAQDASLDGADLHQLDGLYTLAENGNLSPHGSYGTDYFGYVRVMWADLPPVYMGRAMCDQALMHYTLHNDIPLIDGTLAITAIHQFHDYTHVSGGQDEVMKGEDRDAMAATHNLHHSVPTVIDANWSFGPGGELEPNTPNQNYLRRTELALRYKHKMEWVAMFMRFLQRLGGNKSIAPRKMDVMEILKAWENYLQ